MTPIKLEPVGYPTALPGTPSLKDPKYIISSIPHSGTNTASQFLRLLKVEHTCIHTQPNSIERLVPFIESRTKFIIPQRDPREVYLSFWHRAHDGSSAHKDADRTVGDYYHIMEGFRAQIGPARYMLLPIDKPISASTWVNFKMFLDLHDEWAHPRVLAYIHEWPRLNPYPRTAPDPELPQWLEDLRPKWGYSTLNDAQS